MYRAGLSSEPVYGLLQISHYLMHRLPRFMLIKRCKNNDVEQHIDIPIDGAYMPFSSHLQSGPVERNAASLDYLRLDLYQHGKNGGRQHYIGVE